MSHNVFANAWEIAGKSGMNKSISRFPDVCLSPPSPPAGPIPVPYPDTSFSTDLKEGSKTVELGGEPAALAQQSYYQPSLLGDEAATRSFGANVVTHQITGKTFFQAWSMDVKIEGKNVCRHLDITTSNHGSTPPGTPPAPSAETQTLADAQDAVNKGKCPCCGQDLHPWQKDASGNAFTPIKENDFWQKKIDQLPPERKAPFQKRFDLMKAAKAKSREAVKAGQPGCPNVHNDEEAGCSLYFDVPAGAKSTYTSPRTKESREITPAKTAKLNFEDGAKDAAVAAWEAANPDQIFKKVKLNHKTPSMAGGCNNPHNVVPESVITENECKDIEAWQSGLEEVNNYL
jgi:hypothetical protein